MIKISHILKDNKSGKMPQRLIFFDTETVEKLLNPKETQQVLRLGSAVFWRRLSPPAQDKIEWFDFTEADDFWVWAISKLHNGERLFLIAHNVAFDFKVLKGFGWLRKNHFKVRKIILNGFTNIWEFVNGSKTLVILDNMNYFKSSLASLGYDLNFDKFKMPVTSASAQDWQKYCRRDVEIMLKAWQNWLAFLIKFNLGCFGKTLPSQALNAFRHRFMLSPLYISAFPNISELERLAYHGGRTEAFFIGQLPKQKYYYLDVNSMYPAMMAKNLYPSKLLGHFVKPKLSWFKSVFNSYCFIAKVIINTDKPVYPCVINKRLVFPIGKFETSLSTRELEFALAHNHIESILDVLYYEKQPIFKKYVNFFYKARMKFKVQNNPSFAHLCKLMLNSLYGKFGQRNEVYEYVGFDENAPDGISYELAYQSNVWTQYRSINGRIERLVGFQEGFNSFPGLAAHITADARIKLYNYIEKAGVNNTYYCDTDSLFVNLKGYNNLKTEIKAGELGKLSLVKSSNKLSIYGLKDYEFGDEKIIKGVRKNAIQLDATTFVQTQFEGLRGALKKGRLNSMITGQVTKHLTRNYTKGNVTNNGWVKPFTLAWPNSFA